MYLVPSLQSLGSNSLLRLETEALVSHDVVCRKVSSSRILVLLVSAEALLVPTVHSWGGGHRVLFKNKSLAAAESVAPRCSCSYSCSSLRCWGQKVQLTRKDHEILTFCCSDCSTSDS